MHTIPRARWIDILVATLAFNAAAGEAEPLPERWFNGLGCEFALIQGGSFRMGLAGEEPDNPYRASPVHEVRLSPFYMARGELTKAQYRQYVTATGQDGASPELDRTLPDEYGRVGTYFDEAPSEQHPMFRLSWVMADRFCTWLSGRDEVTYRLPTEAEWEYACRAGRTTYYWWGNGFCWNAYNDDNMGRQSSNPCLGLAVAGMFTCNPWGIYDMLGNADEWCLDRMEPGYYERSPLQDPMGPETGKWRVLRGANYRSMRGAADPYSRYAGPAEFPQRKGNLTTGGIRLVVPIREGFRLPADARLPAPIPPPPVLEHRELPLARFTLAPGVAIEMLQVPAGEVLMGSPPSEVGYEWCQGPQTKVVIPRPFWLGRSELTQAQFEAVMGPQEWYCPGPERPVHGSPMREVPSMVLLLNDQLRQAGEMADGAEFREPHEAEWEYACRAGTTTAWFCGDDPEPLSHFAWFDVQPGPQPVGQKLPNPWGFHDICGNVWEMTWIPACVYPGGEVVLNNPGLDLLGERLWNYAHRGGGWNYGAIACRCAVRSFLSHSIFAGVRLAKGIPAPEPVLDAGAEPPAIEPVALPCMTVGLPGDVALDLIQVQVGHCRRQVDRQTLVPKYQGITRDSGGYVMTRRPFWLGKLEITQQQWLALMRDNPSHTQGPDHPVENVSISDMGRFCALLTERERAAGRLGDDAEFRLPDPQEWEYACRAGTSTSYCFGNDARFLPWFAWHRIDSGSHAVGQLLPNALGFYDMHGNVWEAIREDAATYNGGDGPMGIAGWKTKVHAAGAMGGSWNYGAVHSRSDVFNFFKVKGSRFLGFRVLRTVSAKEWQPSGISAK